MISKPGAAKSSRDVAQGRGTVIITKRGRPVAKLVPAGDSEEPVYGFAKGRITIHDHIVEPIDVEWEAALTAKRKAGAHDGAPAS